MAVAAAEARAVEEPARIMPHLIDASADEHFNRDMAW
jgi:hypothetical protein